MRSILPQITFDPTQASRQMGWLGRLMFSFEGRTGRRDFWIGSLAVAVLLVLTERVLFRILPGQAPLLMWLAGALSIYPFAALATKRALDRGHGQNRGVVIVLLAVMLGVATKALASGPFAVQASAVSLAIWLFALVELGLLPSAPEKHDAVRTVGAEPPR